MTARSLREAGHAASKIFLRDRLNVPDIAPAWDDPDLAIWQRYMRRDCLHLASAVGRRMRLPVGRLMKGGQLAHAFVILPDMAGAPDEWACLDWSGVRTMKRVRKDMQEAWGRLTFAGDLSPIAPHADAMRDARRRPHIVAAMRLEWPRVAATLWHSRLRHLDMIDTRALRTTRRRPDVIDVA